MDATSDLTVTRIDASSPPRPPADWVEAVTRRSRDDADDLERARAAEERAEQAERRVQALERALTTRAALDQAKGILMAMFGLDSDGAFNALVWVSQHANVKVCVIAERFVARACTIDLTSRPHDRLTSVLSELTASPDRGSTVPRGGEQPHAPRAS